MKTLITAMALAALTLGAGVASAESKYMPLNESRGEQRLARMLEGHVQSGEPKQCITTYRSNGVQVIENVGLVYDAGKTIWVARSTRPENLDWNDVPVIDRFSSSQLCTNDMMRTVDRTSGFMTGVLFLEDFVPYTRVEDAEG